MHSCENIAFKKNFLAVFDFFDVNFSFWVAEVVKALFEHHDSCHFAYIFVSSIPYPEYVLFGVTLVMKTSRISLALS